MLSTMGEFRAWVRPDGRCCLFGRDLAVDDYGPALDEVLADLRTDVYVETDEVDLELQWVLADRSFAVNRREHVYLLATGLSGEWPRPAGFDTISAADADVARLMALDDLLRQDVPGSDGWRNDPERFVAQTFGDPQFDPATYLVAVETRTGEYAGLARVWIRPDRPRLGLIGVARPFRRQGLAMALLARTFGVLAARGQREVVCEVDETNVASNTLMAALGARRIGGYLELVRTA
jgi:RimJ/RimL family protein N-acetyltransferase